MMHIDPYAFNWGLPENTGGTQYYARSLGSDVWVWFGDLPEDVCAALWERHKSKLFPVPFIAPGATPTFTQLHFLPTLTSLREKCGWQDEGLDGLEDFEKDILVSEADKTRFDGWHDVTRSQFFTSYIAEHVTSYESYAEYQRAHPDLFPCDPAEPTPGGASVR
jgi:hypothetical protein